MVQCPSRASESISFNLGLIKQCVPRMMDTAFYNQSEALGAVGPNNPFYKTDPPRKFTGMQNIGGPNDNVFVNT